MTAKQWAVIFLSLSLMACESKFEEKSAVGSQMSPESKKEYSAKSQDILERLSNAQDLLAAIKSVLQKVQAPDLAKFAISDLVVDVIDSVKVSQAQKNGASYITEGTIYLDAPGISTECRNVVTRSTFTQKQDQIQHSLDIQTCKTGDEFKQLAEINISQDSKISVSLTKNLKDILPDLNSQQFLSVQGCSLGKEADRILSIQCNASDLQLNDREFMKFDKIIYRSNQNPVLQTSGVLMKDDKSTLHFVLEIDGGGKTFSKITPDTNTP